ncbi:MAG: IS21 family transposase [Solirubrobacterales bacterium]|nr:IS21 family transposase [Solirubrobacterales bacterium]
MSALEWAEIRALAKDGILQREIASRLGINRRTVARALAADQPPRYVRAPAGSQLDPLMPVIRRVLEQWPEIKAPRLTELLRAEHGYEGSVDLVRRKLQGLRPREERPAQRTGYRPGQVVQFDWGELPTRPRIAGIERRVYALIASLPFSGAQTAHFSFDMTLESFLEGHVRVFDRLGGVPRECVYDNLRSVVGKRNSRQVVRWNQRFLHLRGHYAFHSTTCTPATPREKGSVEGAVRYVKTGFWPARRFATLPELDLVYATWRDQLANRRRHATGRFIVAERLAEERQTLRPQPPALFDFSLNRTVRVPTDGYLRYAGCFYRAPVELVHQGVELHASRDQVWICWRGQRVAEYSAATGRGCGCPSRGCDRSRHHRPPGLCCRCG